jgi:GntR family transcriptional regulator/MocR family aminotransferase
MVRSQTTTTLAGLALDRASSAPLYSQLYERLRQAILAGQLAPGIQLPSSRALATELDLSRNTVITAFQQLFAEGYIEGKPGSGTYVASALPDDLLQVRSRLAPKAQPLKASTALSQRGVLLEGSALPLFRGQGEPCAFRPGVPALDAFPFNIWSRLQAKHWRRPPSRLLGYGDPAGYRPLREAIAAYLGAARAVRCEAEQVIVISGSQQGLDLAARLLLDPGDAAWIEDPGYPGARGALLGAGAQVIPVPIDQEGLDVATGTAIRPEARLAYVSPSHQYPLGITMSLARRLALLEWARRASAWIVEDDYDSEYRYAGRPLAALQGLDTAQRVIYIGSFSKVLFPSLRLGYLVVPSTLVEAFIKVRALTDRHSPTLDQAVLAAFLAEGHFARHIRRMRALYEERQAMLLEAARRELAGLLTLRPAEAGLHLVGWLPAGVNDLAASQRAAALGIEAPPLSHYALRPLQQGGLVLGYAGLRPDEISDGARSLAQALRPAARYR